MIVGVLALMAQLGCTSDNHATWWIGDVAPDWHDCHAIPGSHAVLDLQEFHGSLILPFAWGGYRLFILTEPSLLQPGATLSIPSPQATAILCDLRHGASGDVATDVSGTVRALESRGSDILLALDLHGRKGDWEISDKQWFERQSAPLQHP